VKKIRTSSVLEMSVLQFLVQFLGMSGLGNTSFDHIDTVRNVRSGNSVFAKVSSIGKANFRGCWTKKNISSRKCVFLGNVMLRNAFFF
jgi:hypothetical protein